MQNIIKIKINDNYYTTGNNLIIKKVQEEGTNKYITFEILTSDTINENDTVEYYVNDEKLDDGVVSSSTEENDKKIIETVFE